MIETVTAFLITALVIELTPGPNMGYLVMTALAQGRRQGLAQVAGIALGLALAGGLSALGLNRLFALWPASYDVVRWAGFLYLLYLSFDAWRETTPVSHADAPSQALPLSRYAVRGLISNLLNPKAYLFYVSVLPEFYTEAGPLWQQSLLLTTLYVCVATSIHLGLVFAAGHLRPLLLNRTGMIWLGRIFAISLAAIALWLFIATRR